MRTKIVATIGPATADRDSLVALAEAGMSVARLNGSHATLDWHRATIELIRSVLPHLPILLDIPGRKIRTTQLAHEPKFAAGGRIVFTTDTSFDGQLKVPVNYPDLHLDLKPGDIVFADDGTLRFTVESIVGADIVCRAANQGTMRSRKGINVPFVKLSTALITARDRQMVSFAREFGVDFIGISFVESAEHVKAIRELVAANTPRILAKVENQGGMDHLEDIVEAADAIMIDRGDLSVETSLDTLVIYQKRIIDAGRAKGKPVVVATEMFHSMIENDFPTKAEVADITNAILDGCSATMLSGETAIGRFPLEAVRTMKLIANTAFDHLKARPHLENEIGSLPSQAIQGAIALILRSVPVTKVVAITYSGYAARMLSAYSAAQPILAVTNDEATARFLNICSNVEAVCLSSGFVEGSADNIKACLHQLYQLEKLNRDDLVLVTAAVYPQSGTRMNTIQLHKLADLIAGFGWHRVESSQRASAAH